MFAKITMVVWRVHRHTLIGGREKHIFYEQFVLLLRQEPTLLQFLASCPLSLSRLLPATTLWLKVVDLQS